MTKDEAMRMALEALGTVREWEVADYSPLENAITALRQALEEPPNSTTDVVEPVAKNEDGRITWLVDNWPQNCLLYAEPPSWTPVEIGVDVTPEGTHVVGMYVLMPEAVRYVFYSQFHPTPKREWVGLTDEEEIELDEKYGDDFNAYIDARDAKLKEKNRG